MRLALLQINDGEEIYLIDTIAISDPFDHASFLFSNSVVKIFHSCKEDMEAIYSWTKKEMQNIFDTQLANSFLGDEYSISYQGLVKKKLDIDLEKKETRSNWLRRPLSDDQLKYAALDVEYLIHLYEGQTDELISSGKVDWLEEDIERMIRLIFNHDDSVQEPIRTIPKLQENKLLHELNELVENIANREKINSTLFFSKKAQKDFLRLVLMNGVNQSLKGITRWREGLIEYDLINLLK
tara:strand:- start:726 stop:1442 length:717 start_codon:yes stop_codon:yes gene_type:complete